MVKSITLQVRNEGSKTYDEVLILMAWKVIGMTMEKNPLSMFLLIKQVPSVDLQFSNVSYSHFQNNDTDPVSESGNSTNDLL